MKITFYCCCLSLALGLFSCFFSLEETQEDVVLSEDLIYLSSNKVRFLGRIVGSFGPILDHGFYISEKETFDYPIIESLGRKESLGLFLAESASLRQKTKYYYKAYFSTEDGLFFSDVKEMTTYEGEAFSISRQKGKAGEVTKIYGRNFTNNLDVLFGNTPATIVNRYGDYEVWVEVPAVDTGYKQPVIVQMEGVPYVVDTFRYETGKWTRLNNFEFGRLFKTISFIEDDSFIIGLGTDLTGIVNRDFFRYDFSNDAWNRISLSSTVLEVPSLQGAFSTSGGYFGGGASQQIASGQDLVYVLEDHFYKYEKGTIVSLVDTPFTSYNSFSAKINETIYVFGGRNSHYLPANICYKFSSGSWQKLAPLPFDFDTSLPGTQIGDKVYFITADESYWEFDGKSEDFTFLGQFPINISTDGIMTEIENELVFGLFSLSKLMYSKNLYEDEVLNKLSFPGNANFRNIAHTVHNNSIFILRASTNVEDPEIMEWWKFEPFEFTK